MRWKHTLDGWDYCGDTRSPRVTQALSEQDGCGSVHIVATGEVFFRNWKVGVVGASHSGAGLQAAVMHFSTFRTTVIETNFY
jgi:hypothetical protein